MPASLADTKSFNDAIKEPLLSVIHFAAEWAEQCGQVNDVLDVLAKQSDYSKLKFYTCQAENISEVSLKYRIEAVPTIILFRAGKEIDRVNGVDAAKITEKVRLHAGAISPADRPEGSLEDRLKSLINKANVMLFMKGDRTQPRCGFSKQIIQILNDSGASYETFDILSDEAVRQGLKTYSDWPTYPQLYVKGELIGGLDIVKEMLAAGELAQTLNA